MGKYLMVFCGFKDDRVREFLKNRRAVCVYVESCVYEDEKNKRLSVCAHICVLESEAQYVKSQK